MGAILVPKTRSTHMVSTPDPNEAVAWEEVTEVDDTAEVERAD